MDLHQRLQRIAQRKQSREKTIADLRAGKYPGISPAGEHFEKAPDPPAVKTRRRSAALEDLLDHTARIETPAGHYYRREVLLRPGADGEQPHVLGAFPPGMDSPLPGEALALLSRELEGAESFPRPEEIGFLDTETTGLAGGTGTIAFLVGIGWWEAEGGGEWAFRLEQLLVDDFPHEGALLERLAGHLRRFKVLVTYNGRCFDVPLLRSRGIMNRLPPRLFRQAQVDLLPPSRRLWRHVVDGVTLKNVEAHLLSIERGPDVEGAEIPEVFFELARSGHPGRLPLVVSHNAQDIATLAGLLARIGRIHADPMGCGLLGRWEEFAGIARWREARRDWPGAEEAWRRALELTGPNKEAERELAFRLAACCKRQRRWQPALETWEVLRGAPLHCSGVAWMELAKYHEHVARDLPRALGIVRECLGRTRLEGELAGYLGRNPDGPTGQLAADMAHREERLRRRLGME